MQQWSRQTGAAFHSSGGDPIICCMQFHGPWMGTRGEATHRHFIVYRHAIVSPVPEVGWVFDVNFDWQPRARWKSFCVPQIVPKRGDGTWSIQWAAQVKPP